MSNIKQINYQNIDAKLSFRNYFDFTLNTNNTTICGDFRNDDNCLITEFDFSNLPENINIDRVISNKYWSGYKIPNDPIENYGLTHIDTGTLEYTLEPCKEDNENDFFKVLTETKYVNEYKEYLVLERVKVDGFNTDIIVINDPDKGNVLDFRGGYLQGFYKLHGYDYQVLPNEYENGFTISLSLKKSDSIYDNTINSLYENNDGLFLYMGTRAENKFWSEFKGLNLNCDENIYHTSMKENTYQINYENGYGSLSDDFLNKRKITNQFLIYGKACNTHDGLGMYRPIDFKNGNVEVIVDSFKTPTSLPTNPFLLYGRGNGIKNCDGTIILEPQYTVCQYKYISSNEQNIDDNESIINPINDLIDNTLAFRIKNDGSIQYRYITKNDTGNIIMVEDSTEPNLVINNEWTNISIVWQPTSMNPKTDNCTKEKRLGNLLIYVNCHLKHKFKDFPEFTPKELNEVKEKQIGVPYNITLGGGSIGLLNSKTFDGPDPLDSNLLIEQKFSGTFIGQISNFKIHNCALSWCEIKNECDSKKNKL